MSGSKSMEKLNALHIKDLSMKEKWAKVEWLLDNFTDNAKQLDYCCHLLLSTLEGMKGGGITTKYQSLLEKCKVLVVKLLKSAQRPTLVPSVRAEIVKTLLHMLPHEKTDGFPQEFYEQILKIVVKYKDAGSSIDSLSNFFSYADVNQNTWVSLSRMIDSSQSDIEIINCLQVIQRLQVDSEGANWTGTKLPGPKVLKAAVDSVTSSFIGKNLSDRPALVFMETLQTVLLDKMSKPITLIDYLLKVSECRSCVKIFALQCVIKLVTTYNVDCPRVFIRLYGFFDPQVVSLDGRYVLYTMTDKLLSSTHVPRLILAAFLKKFSRLCLMTPAKECWSFVKLIQNILIRNPEMKTYLNPIETMTTDPFDFYELNPEKSNAHKSWLWEIHCLENHHFNTLCREVSKVTGGKLPELENNLSNLADFRVLSKFITPFTTLIDSSKMTEKRWATCETSFDEQFI